MPTAFMPRPKTAFWAVCLAVLYLLGDGAMALRPVGRKT
jgi:hypothetical protein